MPRPVSFHVHDATSPTIDVTWMKQHVHLAQDILINPRISWAAHARGEGLPWTSRYTPDHSRFHSTMLRILNGCRLSPEDETLVRKARAHSILANKPVTISEPLSIYPYHAMLGEILQTMDQAHEGMATLINAHLTKHLKRFDTCTPAHLTHLVMQTYPGWDDVLEMTHAWNGISGHLPEKTLCERPTHLKSVENNLASAPYPDDPVTRDLCHAYIMSSLYTTKGHTEIIRRAHDILHDPWHITDFAPTPDVMEGMLWEKAHAHVHRHSKRDHQQPSQKAMHEAMAEHVIGLIDRELHGAIKYHLLYENNMSHERRRMAESCIMDYTGYFLGKLKHGNKTEVMKDRTRPWLPHLSRKMKEGKAEVMILDMFHGTGDVNSKADSYRLSDEMMRWIQRDAHHASQADIEAMIDYNGCNKSMHADDAYDLLSSIKDAHPYALEKACRFSKMERVYEERILNEMTKTWYRDPHFIWKIASLDAFRHRLHEVGAAPEDDQWHFFQIMASRPRERSYECLLNKAWMSPGIPSRWWKDVIDKKSMPIHELYVFYQYMNADQISELSQESIALIGLDGDRHFLNDHHRNSRHIHRLGAIYPAIRPSCIMTLEEIPTWCTDDMFSLYGISLADRLRAHPGYLSHNPDSGLSWIHETFSDEDSSRLKSYISDPMIDMRGEAAMSNTKFPKTIFHLALELSTESPDMIKVMSWLMKRLETHASPEAETQAWQSPEPKPQK